MCFFALVVDVFLSLLPQVFAAVALPSLAYRDASDYNADLEGTIDHFSFL